MDNHLTTTELQTLIDLAQHAGERFSQRDVAKALHVSPTSITNAVGRLTVPLALKAQRGRYVRARELELAFRLSIP